MKIKLFLLGIFFILVAVGAALYGILSNFTGFKLEYKLFGFLPVFSNNSQSSLVLIVVIVLIVLIMIVPLLRMFKL